MSYLTVYEPPMFEENIHETKEEDLITAELENDIKGKLLNNDVYLKQGLQKHTNTNDIHVTAEEKKAWSEKAANTEATIVKAGLLSATDKRKLDTVKTNAEENQNVISNVKVGGTVIQANSKTSQVEIVAGSNITLTGDNATKKIKISSMNTVYNHPSTHPASMITGLPQSLPANGGNADTVDNYHIIVHNTVPTNLPNGTICFVWE